MPDLQMHSFINSLPIAIYCKNKEGIYIMFNDRAKQLVEENGFDGNIIGKTDIEIFPKALAEQFRSHDMRVMTTGEECIEEEDVVVHGSNKIQHQISIKRPLKDDDGEVIGIVGVTLNVSFIKKQQESLQISLNNILHHAPGYLYWKDKNSVYLGCNKNFLKAAGLKSPIDIIGKRDADLSLKKIEATLVKQGDAEILSGRTKYDFQESNAKSDKQVITLGSKVPLFDAKKKIIGILGHYHQMTETRTSETTSQRPLPSVLLISDSLLEQTVLKTNLPHWGYGTVEVVATSKDALKKILQKKYDLIYLDLNVDDDNQTLVQQIKQQHAQAPIIALTGYSDAALNAQYLTYGIDQVLLKPLQENEAKNVIATYYTKIELPIVDWNLWHNRCGNHEDLVQQAFDMTMQQLGEFRDQMITAIKKQDDTTLKEITHKCLGGLKYCGLPQLEAATNALNQALVDKKSNGLPKLCEAFVEAVDAALQVKYEELS